jgi:K+-transporting ATPase A subunit
MVFSGSALSVLLLTSSIMFDSIVATEKQKNAFSGILIFLIYSLIVLSAFKLWNQAKFPKKVVVASTEEGKSSQLGTTNIAKETVPTGDTQAGSTDQMVEMQQGAPTSTQGQGTTEVNTV